MTRKFPTIILAVVATAACLASVGCSAKPSAADVCGTTYSIWSKPPDQLQGNVGQLAIKWGGVSARTWTVESVSDTIVIVKVYAGSDADHLITYYGKESPGVKSVAVVRQQTGAVPGEVAGVTNRTIFACGEPV